MRSGLGVLDLLRHEYWQGSLADLREMGRLTRESSHGWFQNVHFRRNVTGNFAQYISERKPDMKNKPNRKNKTKKQPKLKIRDLRPSKNAKGGFVSPQFLKHPYGS
jgi:hypothetical protein